MPRSDASSNPTFSGRRAAALLLCALVATSITACGARRETLDQFKDRWHRAVNNRAAGDLYQMLDSASRRKLRHDLETMRGLTLEQQRLVIDALGGERIDSLMHVTPERYFALLWDKLTAGERPTMSIEASGDDAAYMILGLSRGGRQRIRLVVEAGRWAWVLPEQRFE